MVQLATTVALLATVLPLAYSTPVVRDPPTRVSARAEASVTEVPLSPFVAGWPEGSCHMKFTQYKATSAPYSTWVKSVQVLNPSETPFTDVSLTEGQVGSDRDNAFKIKVGGLSYEVWLWQWKAESDSETDRKVQNSEFSQGELNVAYDTTWWDTRGLKSAADMQAEQNGQLPYNPLPAVKTSVWWALEEGDNQEGASQKREVTLGWKCQ